MKIVTERWSVWGCPAECVCVCVYFVCVSSITPLSVASARMPYCVLNGVAGFAIRCPFFENSCAFLFLFCMWWQFATPAWTLRRSWDCSLWIDVRNERQLPRIAHENALEIEWRGQWTGRYIEATECQAFQWTKTIKWNQWPRIVHDLITFVVGAFVKCLSQRQKKNQTKQ